MTSVIPNCHWSALLKPGKYRGISHPKRMAVFTPTVNLTVSAVHLTTALVKIVAHQLLPTATRAVHCLASDSSVRHSLRLRSQESTDVLEKGPLFIPCLSTLGIPLTTRQESLPQVVACSSLDSLSIKKNAILCWRSKIL